MFGKKKLTNLPPKALHQSWLAKALALAHRAPTEGGSPHPAVKVGAIFVNDHDEQVCQGVNRFANGLDNGREERYENGTRSLWINCAEQMALAEALRLHKDLKGSRLYVTLEPCTVCAGLLVECGVKEVIVPASSQDFYAKLKEKWKKSITIGRAKLAEAGVRLTYIDMPPDIKL